MGCFDTVIFSCPSCGRDFEEQNKGGRCELKTYRANQAVPTEIAIDIVVQSERAITQVWDRSAIRCPHCEKLYKVEASVPRFCTLMLVEPEYDPWEEDDEE